MKVVRLEIPSGEPGTDATVRIIRQLIESGKRSLKIRHFAEWILNLYNVSARDRLGEIAAIHEWAKRNIRYVQDPYRVEYVQTPERLLVSRTGDCDDFTALVGSLVEAIGYPVDIKVVAKPGRKQFHHVYPIARIGAETVGLDASMPVPLGYESPEIGHSKTYRSESSMIDVFGNVGLGAEPLDLQIDRANGAPRGGGAVVITGGNGLRKPLIYPRPSTEPVIYPPPPVDVLVPIEAPPLKKFLDDTIIHPGAPNGVVVPTEGAGQFGPIIYLKLGQSWAGYDAKMRMDTGNLRPATENLMLVFKLSSPGTRNMHGTVTAVLKPTNGGYDAVVEIPRPVTEPALPSPERVTVPEYDIFGTPTTQPVVVTTPVSPAAGIDTKTMLMIGGGLLALMLLLRK